MALLLHYLVAKLFRWWSVTWVGYLSKLTFSVAGGHSTLSDGRFAMQGSGVRCLCLDLYKLTDTPWEITRAPVETRYFWVAR